MAIATATGAEKTAVDDRAGKYLIFSLGDEEFGINVMSVREIIGLHDITPLPHAPAYLKGVVNLRGKVIPVVDLRVRFGMEAKEYDGRTCTVVVDVVGPAGASLVGLIVDTVTLVVPVDGGTIVDSPDLAHGPAESYVLGLAKTAEGVRVLVDVEKILSASEARRVMDLAPEEAGAVPI